MFDKLIDVLLEFIGYFKFWRVIPINKKGVRIRWGKHPIVLEPGVHFVWPFEIDSVKTAIVESEWMSAYGIHITTIDNVTASIAPTLRYKIIDIITWLYKNKESDINLHDVLRLCSSDVLSDCTWDECMKKPTWTKIKNKIKDKTKLS